jgi:two-component system sensor histidine kinase VicK
MSLSKIIRMEDGSGKESIFLYGNKYIHAYFAVYFDEAKNYGGVVVVLQDNTEQQRMDRLRKEFVANVSHELRTPITTIKSYSETILESDIDDATKMKFLGVINSEADRMTFLVRDLLQLSSLDYIKSKGEEGSIRLNMSAFQLTDLVRNCAEKIKVGIKGRNITIENNIVGDIPEITADYNRIEQVVINIIGNAAKYTPDGGRVTVYTGVVRDYVYVRVIDTGIGISKEDLPRVFERFYRVDKARTREMGGTGLGLAIAKEIIEVHGGEIDIKSELNRGTEVTIRLPVRTSKASEVSD